jgi:TolB protein
MLSDEQLIEQIRTELRSELADLNPPPDLLDRLLEPAENDSRSQRRSGLRSADRRDRRRWRARVRGLGAAVPVLAAVIVVLVVAVVALTSLRPDHRSTPAGARIASHNGKVVFVGGGGRRFSGRYVLWFANPDGSGMRGIGGVPESCVGAGRSGGASCFAWSPDGRQLAYLAGGSHKLTLYLVGADGQDPRQLTACGDCQGVSWSPAGSQIAVGRYVGGQLNVWVVNAATGAMHPITDCPAADACSEDRQAPGFQLQWSPDGQEIFFIRSVGVGTVRPDGSDQTELKIPDPSNANWSPDGHELAVAAVNGVYIVDAAGTVRKLAQLPDAGGIAWSPDGRELAVAAAETGIFTVHADGTDLTRLVAGRVTWAPAWSPNGKQLAYGALGRYEGIWTINADGSDRRLIDTMPVSFPAIPAAPIWSPDGRQIALSSDDGTYVVNADGTHVDRIGRGFAALFGPIAFQPIPSTR